MGMTLWVHILNSRKIESDETDHSWMHRLHEPLDAMFARDGVEKLSAFFDYTDLEHNMDGKCKGVGMHIKDSRPL